MFFPDEPALAMGLRGQEELFDLIQQIVRERNIAVVLCSHLLTETEHLGEDVVILNLGQPVAKDSVKDPTSRDQRNVMLSNYMRIQVPPAAVLETRQVLNGMPNILKLSRINEVEGWLEIELLPASNKSSVNTYHVNRILRALIRAKIPIISFAPENGQKQHMNLNLATDVIR